MKAAIYIRVSTDEQAKEGYSIPAQRERLMAYAHSQDWEVVDIYADEGRSGKDLHRPQLHRLLSDLPLQKFNVVLVYRLDRLTRSVLDLYSLLQEFDSHQVTFKSATEVYDTTTAIGRLFITLVAALAQWERENLGERTRIGKEQKVRQGKRAGGKPPLGYHLVQGNLVVHSEEAEVIRQIFRLYQMHQNLNTVAIKLFEQGYVTRSNKPFSVKTIRDLLRNPAYSGMLRYNYTKKQRGVSGSNQVSKPVIAPETEWILIPEALPAIIPMQEFESVQQILTSQSHKKPRSISSTYLFSGLVNCPNCNQTLLGKTSRTRKYYHCSYSKPGACHRYSIREDVLEKLFLHKLTDLLQHVNVQIHVKEREGMWQEQRSVYQKELGQLQQKKNRLQQLYVANFIQMNELSQQYELINKRECELQQLVQEADQSSAKQLNLEDLALTLLDLPHLWKKLSQEDKKKIVQLLVERIHVSKETTGKNTFDITSIWFHQ